MSAQRLYFEISVLLWSRDMRSMDRGGWKQTVNKEGSRDLRTIKAILAPMMQYGAVAWPVYRDKPR